MYTLEVKRFQNRRSNMSFLEKEFSKRHVQEEEADGEEEESDDEGEESDDEEEESDDEEEESDDEAEETDDHGDDSSDNDNEDQDEDTTAPVANSIAPTSNPGTIGTASELTVPLNTGQNGVQNSLRSGPAKVQTSVVVVTVIATVAVLLAIIAFFVRRRVLKRRAEGLVLPQTGAPTGPYTRLNEQASPLPPIITRTSPGRRKLYESRIWGASSSDKSESEVTSAGFFALRTWRDRIQRALGKNPQPKQLEINADPFQNIGNAPALPLPPIPGTMYRAGYKPNLTVPAPIFIQRTAETEPTANKSIPGNTATLGGDLEQQSVGGTLSPRQDELAGEKRYSNTATERTEPPRWRTPMSWAKDQRERLILNRF